MTYIPPKKFTTDKLPTTGNDGDIVFHDTLKKPLYWNNGWHQTGDDSFVGPIDLFLIAGQSNAHGHAEVSGLDDDQIVTNDVFFYTSWHYGTSNASDTQYYTDWSTDVVAGQTTGTIDTIPIDNTVFGPEVGFARRGKELSTTKNRIGILKYAVGASQLTADQDGTTNNFSDWDLTATGDREGDALRGWKLAVTDGLNKLTAAGLTYNIKGLIWWQGESGGAVDDYKSLFSHMRDYLNKPNLPIIVTIINYSEAVRNKYIQLATDDDYIEDVDAGEFGHMEFTTHPNHVGAADEGGTPKDMFNIGMEYANVFATMFGESPITKIEQTITFPVISNKTTASSDFDLDATSSSGLDVTYTSSDTSVVTITGKTVTIVSDGTATITARQAGDNSYQAATDVTQNITVSLGWEPAASDTIWWVDPSETGSIRTVTNNTSSDPNNDTWVEDTIFPPVPGDKIIVKTSVTLGRWHPSGSGSNTFTTGDILEVWMIQNGGTTVTLRDPNNTANFEYLSSTNRGTQWEVAKAPDDTSGVIDKINLKTSPGTLANYPGLIKANTTISTTTINSRQALRFGAPGSSTTGDTYLKIPGGYNSNAIPTGTHIWYFLVKPFDIGTDAAPTLDGSMQVNATGNTYIYLAQNGKFYFGASNSFTSQQTLLTNDQLNLLAFELDWDNDTLKVYLNGELDFTGDTMDGSTIAGGVTVDIKVPDSTRDWSLFHYNSSYLEGDLCEFIASTAVDKTTRQKTEGYLAHKWGFTDLLLDENGSTTTHPYKSAAPQP